MEHFQRKEYAQAVDCFEAGTSFGGSSKCLLMLGKCYEQENPKWTCDDHTRFYDGYTLNTDFFNLTIRRGCTPSFESSVNGRFCVVVFPCDADLCCLYVQEAIMNKVRALLKEIQATGRKAPV